MAKEVTKTTTTKIKIKKKLWYKIVSPAMFGSKEIGESYLASPQSAVGRIVQVNLKDLSGNIRDQNAYIHFQITHVTGNVLHTTTRGYELTAAFVKRLVRKNTTRLDDYMMVSTKDGQKVVLKSFGITLHKVQRLVRSQIRRELTAYYVDEMAKADFETFVANLTSGRLLFALKKKLHKLHPMKEVAIRVLRLQGGLVLPESIAAPVVEKQVGVQEE